MTTNKRAKRDARNRQRATGERYVVALRHSGHRQRCFEPDCCANCLLPLPDEVDGLFCGELCAQVAETVRYWRRVSRDGRIEQADVRQAVLMRVAHLLAGGYHGRARQLPARVRQQVWQRDAGRCVRCGRPGAEIDHVADDSADLSNLQLLCGDCHAAKTAERMVPATDEQRAAVADLEASRVQPTVPALLCDDESEWPQQWRTLKANRRQRLIDRADAAGLDVEELRGASRAELVAAIQDAADDEDDGGWTEDDDSGYGPYSYFAHAMAKDD